MLTQFPIGFAAQARNSSAPSSATDILALASTLASLNTTTPVSGGALTINGSSVGNYDYYIRNGGTVSSVSDTEWFTTTEDTASAWVIVKGSLTINSGVTLRPAKRKLFMVVYVAGDLVLNGDISMSLRGANHSATPAVFLRLLTGTRNVSINGGSASSTTNPVISAFGGAGGAVASGAWAKNPGQANGNLSIGSGGGGSGVNNGNGVLGAAGAGGTCFSGGAGGGYPEFFSHASTAGGANGGAGGSCGGVGNPSDTNGTFTQLENGTGGTLIVIVTGTISGAGALRAQGGNVTCQFVGVTYNTGLSGGASGGGVVAVIRGSGTPNFSVSGGTASSVDSSSPGGNGGSGGYAVMGVL